MTPEQDRIFADLLRRLLLKAVAMIEDRYGLTPATHGRREERAQALQNMHG